jgi:hypothetical protein
MRLHICVNCVITVHFGGNFTILSSIIRDDLGVSKVGLLITLRTELEGVKRSVKQILYRSKFCYDLGTNFKSVLFTS